MLQYEDELIFIQVRTQTPQWDVWFRSHQIARVTERVIKEPAYLCVQLMQDGEEEETEHENRDQVITKLNEIAHAST